MPCEQRTCTNVNLERFKVSIRIKIIDLNIKKLAFGSEQVVFQRNLVPRLDSCSIVKSSFIWFLARFNVMELIYIHFYIY